MKIKTRSILIYTMGMWTGALLFYGGGWLFFKNHSMSFTATVDKPGLYEIRVNPIKMIWDINPVKK